MRHERVPEVPEQLSMGLNEEPVAVNKSIDVLTEAEFPIKVQKQVKEIRETEHINTTKCVFTLHNHASIYIDGIPQQQWLNERIQHIQEYNLGHITPNLLESLYRDKGGGWAMSKTITL